MKATDDSDNIDPTPAEFKWTILRPIAVAGSDQYADSNDIVQLDGSESYDLDGYITYKWDQVDGPTVSLDNSTSENPQFTAPRVNADTNLTFQLVVTNEYDIESDPDYVTITIKPLSGPQEPPDPPGDDGNRSLNEILDSIIQNPLNITNSLGSSKEIINILTDSDSKNDQVVCDMQDILPRIEREDLTDLLQCES